MRSLWAGMAMVALTACPQPPGLNSLRPGFAELDRTQLTLPTTETGIAVSGEVVVRNVGEAPLSASIHLEPLATPFSLETSGITVAYDGTRVRVFLPAPQPGQFHATLHIVTQAEEPQHLTVSVDALVKAPPNCEDNNPCTLDMREGEGCSHVPLDVVCDDQDACTLDDRCVDGQCTGGPPLRCDDGVECTVDGCSAESGCVITPRNEACADSLGCTLDLCVLGVGCQNPTAPNGTLCGIPACENLPVCVDGECRALTAPDGFPCEDGDPCSLGDSCRAGACERGVGDPMGVGDPVVVAASGLERDGVAVEPASAVGMQLAADGGVRVAWLSRPADTDAPCRDAACAPILPDSDAGCAAPPADPAYTVALSDVDSQGSVVHGAQLPPPPGAQAAVAAHGATVNGELVIASAWRTYAVCGPSSLVVAIHRVSENGTVRGPWVMSAARNADRMVPLIAVAAEPNRLTVVMDDAPGRLHVWVADTGQEPPAVLRDDVITLTTQTPEQVDRVTGVSASIHNGEVLVAWRQMPTEAAALSCGAAPGSRAFTDHFPLNASEPGVITELGGGQRVEAAQLDAREALSTLRGGRSRAAPRLSPATPAPLGSRSRSRSPRTKVRRRSTWAGAARLWRSSRVVRQQPLSASTQGPAPAPCRASLLSAFRAPARSLSSLALGLNAPPHRRRRRRITDTISGDRSQPSIVLASTAVLPACAAMSSRPGTRPRRSSESRRSRRWPSIGAAASHASCACAMPAGSTTRVARIPLVHGDISVPCGFPRRIEPSRSRSR